MPPPMTGLIQWFKGDAGQTVVATRLSAWADQSLMGQNLIQATPGNQPYVLGDTLNGIPLVTFGVAGDANKHMTTAADLVDRASVPMNGSSQRTVMVVAKPAFDPAYGRTGGIVWQHEPTWKAMAEMRSDFVVNGAYAWFRTVGDYVNALQFTPVTGGAGGVYDGKPTLYEFRSPGFPALDFAINGIDVALTPSVMYGIPGGTGIVTLSNLAIAYLGGIAEVLVWDYDISTDPTAHNQALAYVASRYGGSILVCTCDAGPSPLHTTGITAFADHLNVTFNNSVVLSGPALDVSNWFVTLSGPGHEVEVTSVQVVGSTVRLGVTPQTLNATYTLHLPTVGITDTGFNVFTGLFSLDFLGVPTVVTVQMIKVVDTHTIDVIFAIAVDETDASDPVNYSINNGLTVTSATRITDLWYRLHNEPRQVDATNYTITVSNIGAK